MAYSTQGYRIVAVNSKTGQKHFAEVLHNIYKDDPEYVYPLDSIIERVFDLKANPCFQFGSALRWIIYNTQGIVAGRIAAFIDERKFSSQDYPVGGIGFFECVDDQHAANLLFNTAIDWLKQKGIEAVDGPVNFGENDRYWGLMVDGFTKTPFTTNYHKPYYLKLFENYGFHLHYEMFSNEVDLTKEMDHRFAAIAERVNQKNEVEIRHPNANNLSEFAGYFKEIYNDAWRFHSGFTPITESQANRFAKELKYLIIDKFCPFAFVKGEPVAFIIATPDLNQIFESFNGHSTWWKLLLFRWRSQNNFSWYRKKGILTRGHAIAIGVKPKFQQQGLEAGMMMASLGAIRELGFKKIELRWVGDFNPKVIKLHKAVGAYPIRKHVTLRYLINKAIQHIKPEVIPMGRKVVVE